MSESNFYYLTSQHLPLNQARLLNREYLDREQTGGPRGLRRKRFGQGMHRKQLQGNEVSQLYPIQLLPKEESQLPGALCLHPLSWVSSSHHFDKDELEQLTNPAPNNSPSFSAGFVFVKSVSAGGCKVLVGALGNGRVPPLTCATAQMQSLPLAALASLLRLNQV